MLGKKVGDFTNEFGAWTGDVLKAEAAHQIAMTTEDEWQDIYSQHQRGTGDSGILLSLYDYGTGGIGSVSVELRPDFSYGKLDLRYTIYTELDGNSEQAGIFEIGEEDHLIKAYHEALVKSSKEFAES